MNIESVYELCEAVCDFNDMLIHDRNTAQFRTEQYGDPRAVAQLTLLNNLLEEFEDIVKYAKEYLGGDE